MEDKIFVTPRGVLGKRLRISAGTSKNGVSGNCDTGGDRDGPSSSRRSKPKQPLKRVNPFETDLMERLHLPVWSPSVLKCSADTPPQTDWTINQIAMINPQNIEESPSGHHHCDELEPEMEDRAQRSIQHFFDNFHLPSPTPMCHSHTSPTSGPIHTTVHGVNTDHQSKSPGSIVPYLRLVADSEAQNFLNDSSVLRRKLDFSDGDWTEDCLLKSDDSDVEERRCHGAVIMSP